MGLEHEEGPKIELPNHVFAAHLSSSLSRIVDEFDNGQGFVRKYPTASALVLPTRYEALKSAANMPIRDAILQDPEYIDLRDEMMEATPIEEDEAAAARARALDAYVDFLSGDGSFKGKYIALTKGFRVSMVVTTENEILGPYFYRMLEGMRTNDVDVFQCMAKNYPFLFRMDETDARLKRDVKEVEEREADMNSREQYRAVVRFISDRLENVDPTSFDGVSQAYERFIQMADILVSLVFDTQDNSDWRKAVMQHFSTIYSLTCSVEDLNTYNPISRYERLKNNPKNLEDILAFEESLADAAKPGLAFYYSTVSFWIDYCLDNNVDTSLLGTVSKSIKLHREALLALRKQTGQNRQLFDLIDSEQLTFFTTEFGFFDDDGDIEASANLLSEGIFPTAFLVKYIKEQGEKGREGLRRLQTEIAKGNLNPNNALQKNLEYPAFLIQTNQAPSLNAYIQFHELRFEEEDTEISHLSLPEIMEARAMAYEAANVYWLVKDRLDHSRDVLVIGNQRYGDLFVVRPLEKLLGELNSGGRRVQTTSVYVSSSSQGSDEVPRLFDSTQTRNRFIEYLAKNAPDIVIVDGTKNSFQGETPRFPNSMLGFLNWFLAFNEACGVKDNSLDYHYKNLKKSLQYRNLVRRIRSKEPQQPYSISFWVPAPSNEIQIGNYGAIRHNSPSYEKPEVILVNPVINPEHVPNIPPDLKGHQPGFYNDPEEGPARASTELVLTKRGVEKLVNSRTVDEVITLVQNQIEIDLPSMLKRTDPTFRPN